MTSNVLIAITLYAVFVALHVMITRWVVQSALEDFSKKFFLVLNDDIKIEYDKTRKGFGELLKQELRAVRSNGFSGPVISRADPVLKANDDGTIPDFIPEAPRGVRQPLSLEATEAIWDQLQKLH